MGIAGDLVYIVLAALIGGILAWKFHQPLILGYILAGIVVGPHTGGFTVGDANNIEHLAEIGIALLLFAIGLEFSLRELRRLWRIVVVGTAVQLCLSAVAGFLIARVIGISPTEAVWFGSIIALSSTMVVLKSLANQDSLDTEHGRIMLGVLIAQDLAIIPLMLILPQLSGEHINYAGISLAVAKSAIFLGAMYLFGAKIFPPLFSAIASWGSRELFLLCTLAVALGLGFASYSMGLSFAFGAFVAGILLSGTDFNHQALSDIGSLRDVFGLIFFVSVGMLFDPVYLFDNIRTILSVLLAIIFAKTAATALAVRILGYRGLTPWLAGFGLAQIGEFAFLLSQTGVRTGAMSEQIHSLIISVAVISMVLTPGLLLLAPRVYQVVLSMIGRPAGTEIAHPRTKKREHVVVVGGGVVGKLIGKALSSLELDHVIIELDFSTVGSLRGNNTEIIFGDASHRGILSAANVPQAKLLILTVTDSGLALKILREAKELNPAVQVVARVQEIDDAESIAEMGVKRIVEPQRETGLEMLRQALLALGLREGKIFYLIQQFRSLNSLASEKTEFSLKHAGRMLEIGLHEVSNDDPIAGQNLAEIKLRERFGLSVVGIIRGEDFFPNPKPDLGIKSGDTLALIGTTRQLAHFEEFCATN